LTHQSLRHLQVSLFGAVMGLSGLVLSARAAATALPGMVRAPAYFTEPWGALGALAFALLLPAYLVKWIRYPADARAEFTNPAQLGYCATLPVGMTLVAAAIAPYVTTIADALWCSAAALLLLFQVWGIRRLLEGSIELASVNGGWMILFIGGIVVPGGGIALGHDEASRVLFGMSTAATPFVMGLVFYRAVLGPPLPEAARPTWFIFLVPPSLIYANGMAIFGEFAFLENLFFFATLLAVALLVYARKGLRWPFSPAWWSFTFPLDAYAYAAARYAQSHPTALWKSVAGAALLAATLFVILALARTIAAAARGTLLAPAATPRSAASRAA
jgi:tellurite resistance protein